MTFEIDGAKSDLKTKPPTRGTIELLAKLDALPDGKLYSTAGLAQAVGFSLSVIDHRGRSPEFKTRRVKTRHGQFLWGNPATVAAAQEVIYG